MFCGSPLLQLQPQEISPPPTANLDRSNDKVYENVTGLVKAVIEMSNRIQPAAPEEYVPMVKVGSLSGTQHSYFSCPLKSPSALFVVLLLAFAYAAATTQRSLMWER